jgi:KipI family sensor histidine kinase inhibitor
VQIHRYGPEALLVEVDDAPAALALYRAARSRGVRARDVVPAARTVLFSGCEPERLAVELADLTAEVAAVVAAATPEGALVEVPTTYDGPDLEDVARRWDMTVAEAVATHTALDFVVAFCGFAPGFAYCTGLPAALAVPRHPDPRPRVPVGSVGLAGEFTGVYPTASPGGWRLLGRTELLLWDADRDEPATLAPGTLVRFVAA